MTLDCTNVFMNYGCANVCVTKNSKIATHKTHMAASQCFAISEISARAHELTVYLAFCRRQ